MLQSDYLVSHAMKRDRKCKGSPWFLKMGQSLPLFVHFRSFQTHFTEKLKASAGFKLESLEARMLTT